MSDYEITKEQLKQEKRYNSELLAENKKLKHKNARLKKELEEYKCLLYAKIERLKNGR